MDSMDKSMSRSGQETWSGEGKRTLRIFFTGASANHGNSLNATNSSRSPKYSQKPFFEMFVT